jgi:hypothetical protein
MMPLENENGSPVLAKRGKMGNFRKWKMKNSAISREKDIPYCSH